MPRQVDRDGSGWGKLFGKLSEKIADAVAAPPKRKKEKRLRMDRDSRRGMSGRGFLAQYAAAGPMTLEELLAKLDVDGRAAVLAMNEEQQNDLLRLYEAFDRHLQAPGSHKAAVLDKLARTLVNGRLLHDKRAHGGLLPRLARRVGAAPVGPLRGRVDGLMYLSYVVSALAEPQPGPAAGRTAPERSIAALTNSLALAWPARWAEIALALAFDGTWQGVGPLLRPGGSPPDGLVQGSLLAYARTLPPDGELIPGAAGGDSGGDSGGAFGGALGGAPGIAAKAGFVGQAGRPRPQGASAQSTGTAHGQSPVAPNPSPVAPNPSPVAPDDLTVGQIDLLARILETDRGAELDVEGRDPAWALVWLAKQLEAGVPARAGIVHEGKGRTVSVLQLSDRLVACEGLAMAPPAFLGSLRRVIVDGEYLSRVGL